MTSDFFGVEKPLCFLTAYFGVKLGVSRLIYGFANWQPSRKNYSQKLGEMGINTNDLLASSYLH